jgi:hypothetical protein
LRQLIPFFTYREQRQYEHRLFVSQVEYCTNVVFQRRAFLDRVFDRLLDLNRTIGRPRALSVIFGKRIYGNTAASAKTRISHPDLGYPAIRSHYKKDWIKQYARDHLMLRTEVVLNDTYDLGIPKSIQNLAKLRRLLHPINQRYLDVQQDVLETFIDRDELRQLSRPSISPSGRRTPGLRVDDPRLLAVMQALTRFAPLTHAGVFRTKDLHPFVAHNLGKTTDTYKLSQLRYDLAKLRAKGLVEKLPGTQSYRLTSQGYRICLLFLKLFHRFYAPLTTAILQPFHGDRQIPSDRQATLDRFYAAVDRALNDLTEHLGLTSAA